MDRYLHSIQYYFQDIDCNEYLDWSVQHIASRLLCDNWMHLSVNPIHLDLIITIDALNTEYNKAIQL